MRIRVVSKRAALRTEGAPDAMGLNRNGNAVVFLDDNSLMLELDRSAAEAIAALFKPPPDGRGS